ncbi:hypothetical protein HDU84_002358 [Entophlyctis sp. JEL0112]|nr:hypothetical protein HDU84_002358 [Entophlyctis sp. JEL0112]
MAQLAASGSASYVFATLVTADSYVDAAVVLAHSLRRVGSRVPSIVLVPPQSDISRGNVSRLYRAFSRVIYVPLLRSGRAPSDDSNLALLARPELDITYTKLHVFNLPYDRVCFLDADTVVLRNVDSIFSYLDNDVVFAAAADVGWPDIFNSGVFVTRPSALMFETLCWDADPTPMDPGGDQGLLNSFFRSWSGGSNYLFPPIRASPEGAPSRPDCPPESLKTARLPFVYNVTPSAVYSYLPAFNHFKDHIAIVHFAGHSKPWTQQLFSDGTVKNNSLSSDTVDLYNIWWSVFEDLKKTWALEDAVSFSNTYNNSNPLQSSETSVDRDLEDKLTVSETSKSFGVAGSNSKSGDAPESPSYAWDVSELPRPIAIDAKSATSTSVPSHSPTRKVRSDSPVKMVFNASSATSTTSFFDPRIQPVAASQTQTSNISGSSPTVSPSSRYEWNPDEFSATQRLQAQYNLPVMTRSMSRGAPSPNEKKESRESLFDEEGVSLNPVKKP